MQRSQAEILWNRKNVWRIDLFFIPNFLFLDLNSQIREQKGLGRLWATFEARFFTFSGKHYSVRTEKLHNTFFIYKKKIKNCFDPEKEKKTVFLGLKILV